MICKFCRSINTNRLEVNKEDFIHRTIKCVCLDCKQISIYEDCMDRECLEFYEMVFNVEWLVNELKKIRQELKG